MTVAEDLLLARRVSKGFLLDLLAHASCAPWPPSSRCDEESLAHAAGEQELKRATDIFPSPER